MLQSRGRSGLAVALEAGLVSAVNLHDDFGRRNSNAIGWRTCTPVLPAIAAAIGVVRTSPCLPLGAGLHRGGMNGRPPAQRPVGPATDAQQSSSSSSSSSLGWRRRSGGAVGAGDALGVSTGGGGAGFGTAAGCAGGVAGAGTRGAATIVRGSGAATVLAAVEELGGSLGFATENETATAGLGGGSPRGSSLIAMTAIPTMTPRELAATPAATSRNMTIYRLVMGHAPPVYARAAAPAVPCGTERAKVGGQAAVRASSRPPRTPVLAAFGRHSIRGSKRVPQRSQPEMDCTHPCAHGGQPRSPDATPWHEMTRACRLAPLTGSDHRKGRRDHHVGSEGLPALDGRPAGSFDDFRRRGRRSPSVVSLRNEGGGLQHDLCRRRSPT